MMEESQLKITEDTGYLDDEVDEIIRIMLFEIWWT
jgi:hypothetical protein